MKNSFKKIFIVLIIATVSFSCGFVANEFYDFNIKGSKISEIVNSANIKANKENIDFSIFWDAWDIVNDKYKLEPLDHKEMVYGAISGMVNSLGDPYSVFFKPDESAVFNQDMKGSFGGIGAEIGFKNGVLTIVSPLKNSPSEKAGVLAGDKILKVDGKEIIGMGIDEAVMLIRGEKGTKVKLTTSREGSEKLKEIEVLRDVIVINTVEWKMLENNIAYILISQFNEDTTIEFDKKTNEVLAAGSKGIVLDLRNNPGGYLETAVDIASRFINKGKVIVIQDQGDNNKEEYKARGGKRIDNITIVVLINEGSASASEILAGALRDNNGVKLVGNKTFGKGLVQEMEKLKDGSAIKITIAKWLTPSGKDINHNGIEPDFKVEMTEEDYKNDKDPQLEKALEMLK